MDETPCASGYRYTVLGQLLRAVEDWLNAAGELSEGSPAHRVKLALDRYYKMRRLLG